MNLDELLKPPPEGCLCPFDMTRCEVHPWEERVKRNKQDALLDVVDELP